MEPSLGTGPTPTQPWPIFGHSVMEKKHHILISDYREVDKIQVLNYFNLLTAIRSCFGVN